MLKWIVWFSLLWLVASVYSYNVSFPQLSRQIDIKALRPDKLSLIETTTYDCYSWICSDRVSSSTSTGWSWWGWGFGWK